MSLVISGGWDSRVKFWQWQGPSQLTVISEVYLAMPVHYMSVAYPLMVTAHQDRLIHVWNLEECFKNNSFEPTEVMESTLKFATTAITCFSNGKGFCIGSTEGRCSVRNYDTTRSDKNKALDFCFKCHRVEDPKTKSARVYSINGYCFN